MPCRGAPSLSLLHERHGHLNDGSSTLGRREVGRVRPRLHTVHDRRRQVARLRRTHARYLTGWADLDAELDLAFDIRILGQASVVTRAEPGAHLRHYATRVADRPTCDRRATHVGATARTLDRSSATAPCAAALA